jgi:hypothetical protein
MGKKQNKNKTKKFIQGNGEKTCMKETTWKTHRKMWR